MDKYLDDHRKFQTKSSEVQNTNRPISSYKRIVSASSRADDTPLNVNSLMSRLSSFIESNNIRQSSLFENTETFLDLSEFKQIFKTLGFEITNNELYYLFNNNNSNYNEGYIQGKIFLNNYEEQLAFPPKKENSTFTYEGVNTEDNKNLKEKEKSMLEKSIGINEKKDEDIGSYGNLNRVNNNASNTNIQNNRMVSSNQENNNFNYSNNINNISNYNNSVPGYNNTPYLSNPGNKNSQTNDFKLIENEVFKILVTQEKKDLEEKKRKLKSARIPKITSKKDFQSLESNFIHSGKQKLVPLTATQRKQQAQRDKRHDRQEKISKLRSATTQRKDLMSAPGKAEIRPNTSLIPFSVAGSKRSLPKKSAKQYMIETLQKKEAEEELIKLALEKRNKEFERDCIFKMNESNEICEQIKIPLSFSVFVSEEQGGILMCKMFNKILNKTIDLTFKEFLFEYKKIKKIVVTKEKNDYWKEGKTITKKVQEVPITVTYRKDLLNLNRKERQEEIRKVLINSMQLKVELKKQLKALKEKEIIDPEIIDSNLRLSNLDIFDI